jgi:hypothetical protein
LEAGKAENITISNNTIQNFSAGCIVANPANVIDKLTIHNNTLSGNGNGNNPSFTGGSPDHYSFSNNKLSKASVVTITNLKMNLVKPFYEGLLQFLPAF